MGTLSTVCNNKKDGRHILYGYDTPYEYGKEIDYDDSLGFIKTLQEKYQAVFDKVLRLQDAVFIEEFTRNYPGEYVTFDENGNFNLR